MGNKNLGKIVLGCVIGGILGGIASSFLKSNPKEKRGWLKKMEQVSAKTAHFLQEASAENNDEALREIKETLPKNLLALAAIGINLWKRRKNGKKTSGKTFGKRLHVRRNDR